MQIMIYDTKETTYTSTSKTPYIECNAEDIKMQQHNHKRKKYKIISAKNTVGLEDQVNLYLLDGYKLIGGLVTENINKQITLFQTLIRE